MNERHAARAAAAVHASPAAAGGLVQGRPRSTRAALLREIWGYDESVTSRTVDSHVAGLRQKLEDDARAPRHIITVYGTGYRLRR